MHIESPGRIGRAEGTNRRLRRNHPLYAYIDPSYPGNPAHTGRYGPLHEAHERGIAVS